ncbi:MAG TPA: hypothetical protein VEK38_04520, partial [Candidatus Bathyarchaeia archaeon]|nr:hypothetical protein [Candidatus Bathyarchaeia archaeon]
MKKYIVLIACLMTQGIFSTSGGGGNGGGSATPSGGKNVAGNFCTNAAGSGQECEDFGQKLPGKKPAGGKTVVPIEEWTAKESEEAYMQAAKPTTGTKAGKGKTAMADEMPEMVGPKKPATKP